MIKNNFNELVAQRKLKITRISNDTGISRPTLNALTRDDGKGIQYDTLNILCNYFGVTPCEFFSYIPYDIQYNFEVIDEKGQFIERDNLLNDYTVQRKAVLFINVFDNKGMKKHTFEVSYFVLTTYDTILDVEYNEKDELINEERGTVSKIVLDQKQFENGDNEFILFLKQFEVQWQTKIIDDIMLYFAKNCSKKLEGEYIPYTEVNFNKYI